MQGIDISWWQNGNYKYLIDKYAKDFVICRASFDFAVDDMCDVFLIQADNIAGNQSIISTANAIALNTMIHGSTDNSSDTGIHARCVTAAGQDTNSFYTHIFNLLSEKTQIHHFYFTNLSCCCKGLFPH